MLRFKVGVARVRSKIIKDNLQEAALNVQGHGIDELIDDDGILSLCGGASDKTGDEPNEEQR